MEDVLYYQGKPNTKTRQRTFIAQKGLVMKEYKKQSIRIPFESYFFLASEQHKQRCEKEYRPLNREFIEKRFIRDNPNGYLATNGSFGGCNGSPVRAWEERRWTSWSIETLKQMLDDVGLPWEDGPIVEEISLF